MYTAKHAMLIRDKYPDTDVYVFYIDVRTPGKNFDEFYRRAVEEYGVHYIKGHGRKGRHRTASKLIVQGIRPASTNKQLHIEADLVVLAAAIEPDKSARPLATMLTASMDTNDFFTEAHPKLRPVESPTAGVFLSGCLPGTEGYPGDRLSGERRGREGHRPARQGQADRQPVHSSAERDDVQRLLHLRKGLPVRRDHLCRQGIPYARPHDERAPRRERQSGSLSGLRRLHGRVPVRSYGPQGLLEQHRSWRRLTRYAGKRRE